VPELGDTSPFHFPWLGADAAGATVTTALALLFDRQMGLLTYTPVLLLAIVGAIALWRSKRLADRRLLAGVALVVLPYFGLIASFVFWNGIWNPPARYMTTLVPVLAAPLAMSLRAAGKPFRLLYALLAVPGALLALAMLADARRLWPTYPVFGWLADTNDLPVHLDLRRILPAFSPVDDVGLPASTAWVILASFAIVLVGSEVLQSGADRFPSEGFPQVRGLPPGLPDRRYAAPNRGAIPLSKSRLRPQAAVGWLGAAAVLAGSWYVTNAEYVKPRTLLAEVHRWTLPAALEETRGLAYLDGVLYVTAYRSGTLVAFDPANAGAPRFLVSTPPGTTAQERPSDAQVGPDGLLYVLNNGVGNRALLVLARDEQVVRQIPLEDRSNITMGLAIAPDGQLHVADMVGGRIVTYGPAGGKPTSAWGGLTGGFNNVSGVVLAADGSAYAAEASAHRIQHLAPDGHALRTFPLDCEPQYVVLVGDWLDLTCGAGLLSINTVGGYLQRTRVIAGDAHFGHPRGLTYAPDGTLFVVDDHTLIQYTVQH
jgi:sugar lactone lactonase YvrE